MKKIFSILLLAGCAHASLVVYVSDGTKLFEVNGTDANTISQQTLSTGGLGSMAFSLDGTLYGMFFNGSNWQLGVIDPSTAAVTLRPQVAPSIGALAFDGSTLYQRGSDGTIRELDTTTGAATGSNFACFTSGEGLAFGGDGDAWEGNLDHVVEYAATGGSCSGSGGGGSPSGSGYSGPHLKALAFNNKMYAIDVSNTTLVSFDGSTFPALGLPTLNTIGDLPLGSTSLAVFSTASSAPEPGTLPITAAVLSGLAVWARRRLSTR